MQQKLILKILLMVKKSSRTFPQFPTFPGQCFQNSFGFQDFPGPVATLGVIMGVILLVLRGLARSIL